MLQFFLNVSEQTIYEYSFKNILYEVNLFKVNYFIFINTSVPTSISSYPIFHKLINIEESDNQKVFSILSITYIPTQLF